MSEPVRLPVWEESFTVRSYETDEASFAGVPSLWRYLQEAAGNHATRLGMGVDDLLRIDRTWLLSRLRLRLFRLPAWRDTITVATWPAGLRSLFASRGFSVRDAEGRPVAHAMSDWIYLDVAARKPARPPEWLATAGPEPLPALDLPDNGRLRDPERVEWSVLFPVRRSEVDLNRHVTNAVYVDWALECVPDAYRGDKAAVDVEIVYRAAAVRGDAIRAEAGPEGADSILHRLVRESDGAVLAQARSRWARLNGTR